MMNIMANARAIAICALSITGCASDGTAPRASERLLAQPPDGWDRIYQVNSDNTRITDFVPADQTAEDWVTRVSFESFRKLADADPIEVLLAEVERDREKCTFVQHFNLFSGFENNYPTSIRLILCGENPSLEKGEVELIKAVKGNAWFYIVRIVKRIPPFEARGPEVAQGEIAEWSAWLRRIGLCDPARAEEHPCSAGEE